MDTLISSSGCDSIVTTSLSFLPNLSGSEIHEECSGSGFAITVGSSTYDESNPSGVDTLISSNGCDSIVTTSLSFLPNSTGSEIHEECSGSGFAVTVGGSIYNELNPSGVDTLISSNGCDSIVTTSLSFLPSSTGSEIHEECLGSGFSITVGGSTYDESNPSGVDTLVSSNGCDSIVTTSLSFLPNLSGSEIHEECSGSGFAITVGSSTYNESNPSGIDTLTSVNGCDSIVTTSLVFNPLSIDTIDYVGCSGDGFSIVANSITYDESNPSGIDTIVSGGANGCDSIIVVDLVFDTIGVCDFDLALRKTLSSVGPFSPGDTVEFVVTVFNQGSTTGHNIELVDYLPSGLLLSDSDWTQFFDKVFLNNAIDTLESGDSISCLLYTSDAADE